ncbi:MAG TPA: ferredoxin reductase family protein [Dermatophilaceae bacterium]|nr:ferredoxin reductase family protein [Dermatophilaceae bacterium]
MSFASSVSGVVLSPPTPTSPPTPSPLPPKHQPWWSDVALVFTWLTALVVVSLWVAGGGVQDLLGASGASGALTTLGRLSGLLASDLLLVQVLMMARIPWVERTYGQDRLARWHRVLGFTSFTLMLLHIAAIWLGYAASGPQGVWGTLVDLALNYPGMLLALAGSAALVAVTVTSVKAARRRLRYESWHLIHLYAYLGVGLALPHQLWTGAEFVSSPAASVFWWGLWASAAAAVLVCRVGLPVVLNLRHRLVVQEVRREGPGATTVVVSGRQLHRLPVRAGQYFTWRFLDGPGASRANPYSLSAAPDGRTLRITAAHAGDGSARLARLRPGVRVLVEGPYGRMHEGVRTRRKVLLLAGGIGVAPMRALLEGLAQAPGDVTLVYRASDQDDLLLFDELAEHARRRRARFVLVVGRRATGRESWLPAHAAHFADEDAIRQIVPDVADHDVFICGSPGWMTAAERAVRAAGVPRRHIHLERFSY